MIYTVARVVSALIDFYEWLVIIWCVLSWIPRTRGGWLDDIATVINNIVSPYMRFFRRFIPPIGGLDFSPIIGLFVLGIVQRFAVQIIYGLA